MRLNTITRFSYCMETIIQAGNKQLRIASVPVETNAKTRESRLFTSTRQHVFKSAARDHPGLHHVQAVRHLRLVARCSSGCSGCVPFVRYAVLVAIGERAAATCSRCSRCRAPDPGLPERDARDHLRPDPDQPHPDRDDPRAHQEGRFGSTTSQAGRRSASDPGGAALTDTPRRRSAWWSWLVLVVVAGRRRLPPRPRRRRPGGRAAGRSAWRRSPSPRCSPCSAPWLIGLVWLCLRARCRRDGVDPGRGLRRFFVTQLGKYVPGSVWPVVAQIGRADGGAPRRG